MYPEKDRNSSLLTLEFTLCFPSIYLCLSCIWVLFLLWLHPFILSGVISPLISSSILGTYWPGELHHFAFSYCSWGSQGKNTEVQCQVHESRQIGSGQTRDGKSEHRHSRNQQTIMDCCREESLRRNGVAIIVNKRVWGAVLGCNLKTTEWSVFVSKANHSISQ